MAQVFVLQVEVPHDARREVFGEDIAEANQFAQRVNAILVVEFEREAIFVAILLVEVRRTVPVVSIASVLVERACTVVVEARARLDADYLRAHVAEQFHGVWDCNELSHFNYSNASER